MTTTDLLLITGVAFVVILAALEVRAGIDRKRDVAAELTAARLAGYRQALKDTKKDRATNDADHDTQVQELRRQLADEQAATVAVAGQVAELAAEREKYVGKEPTIAEEMAYLSSESDRHEAESARFRSAYHSARGRARILSRSDVGQLRRMVAALDKRVAEASFQSAAFTVPPTLQATSEELHAAFKRGLAPLVQRQADNDRVRDLRDAGDYEAACAYAQAIVDAQNQAANL